MPLWLGPCRTPSMWYAPLFFWLGVGGFSIHNKVLKKLAGQYYTFYLPFFPTTKVLFESFYFFQSLLPAPVPFAKE
jgi:hypothetical protein